jgi:hypothetical protein
MTDYLNCLLHGPGSFSPWNTFEVDEAQFRLSEQVCQAVAEIQAEQAA